MKRNIIEPLINLIGYMIVPETLLPSPSGKKKPDYTIRLKSDHEVEIAHCLSERS